MVRTSASPPPPSPATAATASTTDQAGQPAGASATRAPRLSASPGPGRPNKAAVAVKLEMSGLNGAAWQPKGARRERAPVAKFEPVTEPVKRRKREEAEEKEEAEEDGKGLGKGGGSGGGGSSKKAKAASPGPAATAAAKPKKSKSLQELLREKAAADAAKARAKAAKKGGVKDGGKKKGSQKPQPPPPQPQPQPPLQQLPLPPPRMAEREFALPAAWIKEVQMQPPPKFRVLKQNCYSDASLRPPREDPPSCHCRPETGCDHNCMNRQLFMECAPGKCPSLARKPDAGAEEEEGEGPRLCSNTAIQARRFHPTEVFKTCDRGWALRTTAAARKGTVLIEYLGEVVTMEEGQARMRRMTDRHDFYCASLEAGLLLDAGPMGSDARFANHSCAPNCVLQKWTVAGEPHIVLVAQRDLAAGEEVTYNYQLDTLEGCFGRQPCRCGARNCSGFIGKRPQGSGLGPREAWRAAARKLLEMRMPPLAALRGLLAEARAVGVGVGGGDSKPGVEEAAVATAAADADAGADGTDGAKGDGEEEYAALLGKAEAAGAWLARYRQLMGGWREEEQQGGEEEEEVKPEAGAGGQDVGGLVEMEALAALVAAAPKDVKLPEATQARNTLTRARQARTALRLLYETALKNWTPPAPSPPPILLPTAASTDEHGQQPQPPPASAMDMDVAGAEAPEPPPAAAAVAEAADAAAPAPADAAAVDASSAPAPPAPTDAAVSAAAAAAAAAAAGASSDTPSATAGIGPPEAEGAAAPPPQWEFVAGGATMKEVVALLRDALACAPVRVPGLGAAVAMLMEVDAWAARACQRLGVKVKEKEGGKGEGDGKAEAGPEDEEGGGRRAKKERQRKAADADPGVLLRRLARLYAGEEGLAPERVAGAFRGLDALEEALADMVEMVISREESKEHERAHQQQEEEKQATKAAAPASTPAAAVAALSASHASIATTGTADTSVVNGTGNGDATAAAAAGTDGEASVATGAEEGGGEGRRASRRAAARKKAEQEEAAAAAAATAAASGNGNGEKKKGAKTVVAPPPEPLRCFCRLPEHEGKMRTLVQCAGCEEWYHPHCVSLAVKEIRYLKGDDYLCPVCRHQRGLSSELAAPPLAGRFGLVRASRPRLEALRALWVEARALTIAEFEAVPFLSFLLDAAEQWRARTRGALLALLPALLEGVEAGEADAAAQATLEALAAEAAAAAQEKAERRAAEEAEAAAAAAKARAAREQQRKSGPVPPLPPRRKLPSAAEAESRWEAHEREELAAVVAALRETKGAGDGGNSSSSGGGDLGLPLLRARLAAESRALRFAARLMCEHRVLEITVSEQLVERLKALLWRLVAPLCLPTQPGVLALTAGAEAADDAAKEARAHKAREELQALLDSAGAFRPDRAQAEAEEARQKAAAKRALLRARRLGRRVGLEALCAVVEEGRRLGLGDCREWRRLKEARDDALFWLRAAAAWPFPRLLPAVLAGRAVPGLCDAGAPALGPPPREALLDYHGEWGYSRARAAVVRSNRLHGRLPPVEGREHLPRPPVTGPKVVWEVDKGLGDEPGEQFCVCRGQESGEMVCCEGCGEWHHFDCVGYRPPAAAAASKGKKPKREEREDGEAAYACIGCSEAAGRPYRYKWTTALFKAYASLKIPTPSAAVPTDAAAALPAAAPDEEAKTAAATAAYQRPHKPPPQHRQPQQQHHHHRGAANGYAHTAAAPPPPPTAPSVASAFAAFSQRAYASSTPEPPVPPPPPIPAVVQQQQQLAAQHQQHQQQPSAAALAEQVMRMVQMQQLQQQLQQQQAAAAAMFMGTGGMHAHAAAPSTVAFAPPAAAAVACAPAVLSAANMASMVPASLLPPMHHQQQQQYQQQYQAAAMPAQQVVQQPMLPAAIAGVGVAAAAAAAAPATATAALPPAPFVVRQTSEASSLGIGGGSGDWGIDENAELLDSFFAGGSP